MPNLSAMKLPIPLSPCNTQSTFGLVLLLASLATPCLAWDPYPADPFKVMGAGSRLPPGLAHNSIADPCVLSAPSSSVQLADAVEHALCHNPQTRGAWANIRAQAAQVGVATAAYLPTLNASIQGVRDHAILNTPVYPTLSTDHASTYQTDTITLSWMLYDFGARSAALEYAKQLLVAAQANYDNALQKTFASTIKDYYAAAAAQDAVVAARENEQTAKQSLKVASARMSGGVAAVSDQLQAQTAYSQAVITRVKAEGTLHNTMGVLALDMGQPIGRVAMVSHVDDATSAVSSDSNTIHEMLAEAERQHPSLRAARAQRDAAMSKADQVRAQGRPSISLTARASRSTQPESLGTGMPTTPARAQERYVGLQLDIPIFEGFGRTYQIRNAEAQVEVQEATLADAEQQVAKDVWTSYQDLKTSEENVQATRDLLDSAQAAFNAGKKRYQTGVVDILELLNVQTALATARQQRIQAIADWHTARYQLASALGKLIPVN